MSDSDEGFSLPPRKAKRESKRLQYPSRSKDPESDAYSGTAKLRRDHETRRDKESLEQDRDSSLSSRFSIGFVLSPAEGQDSHSIDANSKDSHLTDGLSNEPHPKRDLDDESDHHPSYDDSVASDNDEERYVFQLPIGNDKASEV